MINPTLRRKKYIYVPSKNYQTVYLSIYFTTLMTIIIFIFRQVNMAFHFEFVFIQIEVRGKIPYYWVGSLRPTSVSMTCWRDSQEFRKAVILLIMVYHRQSI